MAQVKAPRSVTKKQELRQDVVVSASSKALDFFEAYKKYILMGIGAVVVVALLLTFYFWNQSSNNEKASSLMGDVVRLYETGLYRQAIDGTDGKPGLKKIADDFGNTTSGNLAKFYTGMAYYRLEEKENALKYLESFDKIENVIGASAYGTIGGIYEDVNKDPKQAASMYEKAGKLVADDLNSPEYLRKAARAYTESKDYGSARRMYESIQRDYPDSPLAVGIEFYLANLEALQY